MYIPMYRRYPILSPRYSPSLVLIYIPLCTPYLHRYALMIDDADAFIVIFDYMSTYIYI